MHGTGGGASVSRTDSHLLRALAPLVRAPVQLLPCSAGCEALFMVSGRVRGMFQALWACLARAFINTEEYCANNTCSDCRC